MSRQGLSALVAAAWLFSGCRDQTGSTTGPSAATPPPAILQPAVTTSAALSFWQLSAGFRITCGVTTDKRAFCWGQNLYGELGNGKYDYPFCIDVGDCITHPVAVNGGLHFQNVSTGRSLSCGVTTDNRAYCWGGNGAGELGVGSKSGPEICHGTEELESPCSTRPVPVSGGLLFRIVSTSGNFACGVTTEDRAYCWGDNTFGQLGDGTTTQRLKPVPVAGGNSFGQVSVGALHACGLTTASVVYCWGWNKYGQLGDSTQVTQRLRPVRVSGGRSYRHVDAGTYHTCAVTTAYRAYCWGDGRSGQLGNNKTSLSFWPRVVAGGLSLRRVSAGEAHTCAEATSSLAYCWGSGAALGDGVGTQRLIPVAVAGGKLFAQVTAGYQTACGKTSAGVAYCWGRNSDGQLGDGTTNDRLRPTAVVGPL